MWPTPNTQNGGRSIDHCDDVRETTVYHKGKKVQVGLEAAVKRWPTPTVNDSRSGANSGANRSDPDSKHHDGDTLTDAVRRWPTPSARDWKSGETSDETAERNARPLSEVVTRWPTPRAPDGVKGGPNQRGSKGDPTLPSAVIAFQRSRPDPTSSTDGPKSSPSGRILNPLFVEWLMGFPIGSTVLDASVTQSFRKSRKQSGG